MLLRQSLELVASALGLLPCDSVRGEDEPVLSSPPPAAV